MNCYALISGYVGVCVRRKYSSLLYLLVQVLFYSVLGTALFAAFVPHSVGIKEWIKAFLPFGFHYWYFTAYLGMFFLVPLLNFALQNASRAFLRSLLLGIFIAFSVLPTLLFRDVFQTHWGFSVIHLALMYLAGGYVRRFNVQVKKRSALCMWLLCAAVTFLSVFVLMAATQKILGRAAGFQILVRYTSPTMVVMSVSLLLIFKEITVNGKTAQKIAAALGACSFGVYLVHLHPLVKQHILIGLVAEHLYDPAFKIAALYIALTAVIFLVSAVIDFIRLNIFRLLRVKECCKRIDTLKDKLYLSVLTKQ